MSGGGGGDDEEAPGDKPHEATEKKLADARKRGEVPHSTDLTTAAAYGGLLLAGAAFGASSMATMGAGLAGLLERADHLARAAPDGRSGALLGPLLPEVLGPLAIWFGLPATLALIAVIAQRAFVVAPEKLEPKLSRLSLLSNARQKFGRNGLFEFAKSFVKLVVYALILFGFLVFGMERILVTVQLPPAHAIATLGGMTLSFLGIVLAVSLGIGAIDALWQQAEHQRTNRMSRKELMDEMKESEGDPMLKGQRRRRAEEIATNRMLADVPGADVIVVNPTHYAVALKWSRTPGSAPVCVAKGVDEIAARIREHAAEAGVPIHRDPPTARALHATVEIGQEVRPEHYRAVAAAIRFAETMRTRARRPRA